MGEGIRRRLVQSQFEGPHHEALLNLLIAAGTIREAIDQVCQAHDVTRGQYNVLRILRGAHPDGFPRCEIARRLIERAPDVTRLIDRLEQQGLIERRGSERDRRLSVAVITRDGLALLERMQPDVQRVHESLAARLSPAEAEQLSRACERLYEGLAEAESSTQEEDR